MTREWHDVPEKEKQEMADQIAVEFRPLAIAGISTEEYQNISDFFVSLGLTPTPDAIAQCALVFVPCLRIMCHRGYDPHGRTWRAAGWRGQLFEIRKKAERPWFRSWKRGLFDRDSGVDLINYVGFYLRGMEEGLPEWGEWGEPENEA